jgi:hypothetical protein
MFLFRGGTVHGPCRFSRRRAATQSTRSNLRSHSISIITTTSSFPHFIALQASLIANIYMQY